MSKSQPIGSASTEKFPSDLQEELGELEYYHNAGVVEVEVRNVNRVGDVGIEVVFDPPIGNHFYRRWEIPQSPDERTEFALLLHACGHNLGTAENVIGERVPFTREDGEWEMAAEWPPEPLLQRAADRTEPFRGTLLVWGAFLIAPIALSYLFWTDDDDNESTFKAVGTWGMMVMMWACIMTLFSLAIFAIVVPLVGA